MPSLKPTNIEDFCHICLSAHDLWKTSKIIFSNAANVKILQKSKCPYYLGLMQNTFQKQMLLEISKIHDPAEQMGRKNLTIDYILNNGSWDAKTFQSLTEIYEKLKPVAQIIKKARNHILAHHDLKTIEKRKPLGGVKSELFEDYFKNLESFANIAREKVIGRGYAFNNAMLYNDSNNFLTLILEDTRSWQKKE